LKNFLIVIAGPTCSGKTAAAISVAKHFKTEIISADSRQLFKEMVIGTAMPSQEQQKAVKHHFIASHSISEEFNAGLYADACDRLLDTLFKKHKVVVMTGGSGMYIDTVLNGMDSLPEKNDEIRSNLKKKLDDKGISFLQEELKRLDPVTYEKMDVQNPQRLMRALEVCVITGKPYSDFLNRQEKKLNYDVIYIGLDLPREELYQRIDRRVDDMISAGLVEEVKQLLPYKDAPAMKTVGYQELVAYFENRISPDEAIDKIKQHTRNYAKRQMTWFRKNKSIQWIDAGDVDGMLNYITGIVGSYEL
jgi:tRNA dimethylallyltransferase